MSINQSKLSTDNKLVYDIEDIKRQLRELKSDPTSAGTGTVTSITAGAGLSGGTITTSGTIDISDAELVAIMGLTSAADRLPYFTGSGTASLATFTAFGRSLVDDADATAGRSTLGLVIGTNVQAWDADLDTWATKTPPSGVVIGDTDTQTMTNKTFTDSTTFFQDDGDNTKKLQFQLSSIGTGTTRTLTVPNASGTILQSGTAVTVAQGGTGRATGTTAYGLVAVGTTATGAQQTISPGTSGHILVSAGAASLAAFRAGAPADVALGNVDNTSDATKNAAVATLTNKTLTSPTIGDFTNATHTHQNAAGGGTLDAAAIAAGTIAQARLGTGSGGAGTKVLYDDQTYKTPSAATAAAGQVVQAVTSTYTAASTGTTIIPQDDTIPQSSEGDEYMTRAITPNSATNRLIILWGAYVSHSVQTHLITALFQDATAGALAASAQFGTTATGMQYVTGSHEMAAGTTSSTTFKIRAGGANAGTMTFNGAGGTRRFGGIVLSWMHILEVKV